jgi:hypothetical protein
MLRKWFKINFMLSGEVAMAVLYQMHRYGMTAFFLVLPVICGFPLPEPDPTNVSQVFDFRTFTWSALNPTRDQYQLHHENNATDRPFPALAGHSLVKKSHLSLLMESFHFLHPVDPKTDRVFFTQVKWKNNLLVVAGNIRSPSTLNKVSGISLGIIYALIVHTKHRAENVQS